MEPRSRAGCVFAAIRRSRKASLGLGLCAAFALLALVGPWLVGDPRAGGGVPHQAPSWAHPLGTTGLGQDVLAQTVAGARTTLAVSLVVGVVTLVLGTAVGLTAGYFRGWIDDVLTLITNVFLVLPGMPLAIVVAAFLPPGPVSMATVLIVTGWAWGARVIRAQTLSLARRDFVAAAQVGGDGAARILVREILPNMASLLGSCLIGATIYAIGAQVGLEFLGLGDPGRVTWGTNLYWAANDSALLLGAWWAFVPTGLCVALLGFALTLTSFGIDEITNPRLAAERGVRARAGFGNVLGAVLPGAALRRILPDEAASSLLAVAGLEVRYGAGPDAPAAVAGVSLDLRPGEIFGLAGESGSGKSTFAGAVLRVLRPPALVTGGAVRCAGRDVLALSEAELRAFRWRDAAMVFQSAMNVLNPVMRVEAQLVDTIRAHEPGTAPAAARERARALVELVGLPPACLARYPHELSGGMRQRVVIAVALALSPRVLVLDEPTTALDVVVQREILARLVRMREERGLAILFITHDLPLLLEVADRIGVMYAGELVELAPAPALLAGAARHPYTRSLLAAFPGLPGAGAEPREIPGAAPRLGALPPGCRFEPRCGDARPACRTARPLLVGVDAEHQVACPVAAGVAPAAVRDASDDAAELSPRRAAGGEP
jgi:oligopeptide/dipeptide ABC transporter ATP-binding protein